MGLKLKRSFLTRSWCQAHSFHLNPCSKFYEYMVAFETFQQTRFFQISIFVSLKPHGLNEQDSIKRIPVKKTTLITCLRRTDPFACAHPGSWTPKDYVNRALLFVLFFFSLLAFRTRPNWVTFFRKENCVRPRLTHNLVQQERRALFAKQRNHIKSSRARLKANPSSPFRAFCSGANGSGSHMSDGILMEIARHLSPSRHSCIRLTCTPPIWGKTFSEFNQIGRVSEIKILKIAPLSGCIMSRVEVDTWRPPSPHFCHVKQFAPAAAASRLITRFGGVATRHFLKVNRNWCGYRQFFLHFQELRW